MTGWVALHISRRWVVPCPLTSLANVSFLFTYDITSSEVWMLPFAISKLCNKANRCVRAKPFVQLSSRTQWSLLYQQSYLTEHQCWPLYNVSLNATKTRHGDSWHNDDNNYAPLCNTVMRSIIYNHLSSETCQDPTLSLTSLAKFTWCFV